METTSSSSVASMDAAPRLNSLPELGRQHYRHRHRHQKTSNGRTTSNGAYLEKPMATHSSSDNAGYANTPKQCLNSRYQMDAATTKTNSTEQITRTTSCQKAEMLPQRSFDSHSCKQFLPASNVTAQHASVVKLVHIDHHISKNRKPRQNAEAAADATYGSRRRPPLHSEPRSCKVETWYVTYGSPKSHRIREAGEIPTDFSLPHTSPRSVPEPSCKSKCKNDVYFQPCTRHVLLNDPQIRNILKTLVKNIGRTSSSSSFPKMCSERVTGAEMSKAARDTRSQVTLGLASSDQTVTLMTRNKNLDDAIPKTEKVCKKKPSLDSYAFKPLKRKENMTVCPPQNVKQPKQIIRKPKFANTMKRYFEVKSLPCKEEMRAAFGHSSVESVVVIPKICSQSEVPIPGSEGKFLELNRRHKVSLPDHNASIDKSSRQAVKHKTARKPVHKEIPSRQHFDMSVMKRWKQSSHHKRLDASLKHRLSSGASRLNHASKKADSSCVIEDVSSDECMMVRLTGKKQNDNSSRQFSGRTYTCHAPSAVLDAPKSETRRISKTRPSGEASAQNETTATRKSPNLDSSDSDDDVHRRHDVNGEELNALRYSNSEENGSIQNLRIYRCNMPEHCHQTSLAIPVTSWQQHGKVIQEKQKQVVLENKHEKSHPSVTGCAVVKEEGNNKNFTTASQPNNVAMTNLASMVTKNIALCVTNAFEEMLKKEVFKNRELLNCGLEETEAGSSPMKRPCKSRIPQPQHRIRQSIQCSPLNEQQSCRSSYSTQVHGPEWDSQSDRSDSSRIAYISKSGILYHPMTISYESIGESMGHRERKCGTQICKELDQFHSALLQAGRVAPEPPTPVCAELRTQYRNSFCRGACADHVDGKELTFQGIGDTRSVNNIPVEQEPLSNEFVSMDKRNVHLYPNITKYESVFSSHSSPKFIEKEVPELMIPALVQIDTNAVDNPVAQIEVKNDTEDCEVPNLETNITAVNVQQTNELEECKNSENRNTMKLNELNCASCQFNEMVDAAASGVKIKDQLRKTVAVQISLEIIAPDETNIAKKANVTDNGGLGIEDSWRTKENHPTAEVFCPITEECSPTKEEYWPDVDNPKNWRDMYTKLEEPQPRHTTHTQSSLQRDCITSESVKTLKRMKCGRRSPRYPMMANTRKRVLNNKGRLACANTEPLMRNKLLERSCQLDNNSACSADVSGTVHAAPCDSNQSAAQLSPVIGVFSNLQTVPMAETPQHTVGGIPHSAITVAYKCYSCSAVEQPRSTTARNFRKSSCNDVNSKTKPSLCRQARDIYYNDSLNCRIVRSAKDGSWVTHCGLGSDNKPRGFSVENTKYDSIGERDPSSRQSLTIQRNPSRKEVVSVHAGYKVSDENLMAVKEIVIGKKSSKSSCHSKRVGLIGRAKMLLKMWLAPRKQMVNKSCSNTHLIPVILSDGTRAYAL